MTNLSKDLRDKISKEFTINPISVDLLQKSKRRNHQNGVKLHDGLMVESVLIPTENPELQLVFLHRLVVV